MNEDLDGIATHALSVISDAVNHSMTPMDACQTVYRVAAIPVTIQRKMWSAHITLDKIASQIGNR